ncbi:Cell division control protein 7 [Coemansia sp. Benny D115]|nr:Cell division control protein 7 [Coemansia sp. Benny D115]
MAKKKESASAKSGGAKGGAKNTDDSSAKDSKLKAANAVYVRHILCEKQGKILEALAQLQEGKDFAKVATEFSEDKAKQGGNLGRMVRGSMVEAFQTEAFRLPPSKTTSPIYSNPPVKTKFGYHIIMVERRE